MIPKNSSKFAPWLPLKEGMVVKILTEPAPKDNEKLTKPFYCEVEHKGEKYSLGFNQSSYVNISKNQGFGPDTADWIGKDIKYCGLVDIKTQKGKVKGHMWVAVETEIDLNSHLKSDTPDEYLHRDAEDL